MGRILLRFIVQSQERKLSLSNLFRNICRFSNRRTLSVTENPWSCSQKTNALLRFLNGSPGSQSIRRTQTLKCRSCGRDSVSSVILNRQKTSRNFRKCFQNLKPSTNLLIEYEKKKFSSHRTFYNCFNRND